MIRQAISCDICGAEKKQTNNWFVAYEHSGELRVSGWGTRNRLRNGSKHLCGQTCLHKLVDEFMARTIAERIAAQNAEPGEAEESLPATDTSLTSLTAYVEPKPTYVEPRKPVLEPRAAYVEPRPKFTEPAPTYHHADDAAHANTFWGDDEFESSARLIPTPDSAPVTRTTPPAFVVPLSASAASEDSRSVAGHVEARTGFSIRRRAEAWEREREREMRAADRVADIAGRRHKGL